MSQTVERAHKGTFYCSHHLLPPRHEERDHRVAFFVSGVFPPPPTTQTRRTRPQGRVSSCLGGPSPLPSTSYHPDTKNVTTRSRPSCLGGPSALHTTSYHPSVHLSLPLVSNTRTSPHTGSFWCSGMSPLPSLVSNTTTCPCGHVLVLGHLSSLSLSLSPSPSPSPLSLSPTSVLHILYLVFTFLVNFYIRIVSFFVFNFM